MEAFTSLSADTAVTLAVLFFFFFLDDEDDGGGGRTSAATSFSSLGGAGDFELRDFLAAMNDIMRDRVMLLCDAFVVVDMTMMLFVIR